jgi:hypothetical protein
MKERWPRPCGARGLRRPRRERVVSRRKDNEYAEIVVERVAFVKPAETVETPPRSQQVFVESANFRTPLAVGSLYSFFLPLSMHISMKIGPGAQPHVPRISSSSATSR